MIPEQLISYPVSFLLPRMSRFLPLLNKRMAQWMEAGLFEMHRKWEMKNVRHYQSPWLDGEYLPRISILGPLPLQILKLPVVIFGCGIFLSFSAFIGEVLIKWKKGN